MPKSRPCVFSYIHTSPIIPKAVFPDFPYFFGAKNALYRCNKLLYFIYKQNGNYLEKVDYSDFSTASSQPIK